MIGTSSTLAGRMSKFSGVFILVLIVHHTRTEATGAFIKKESRKSRHLGCASGKRDLLRELSNVKDESTSRFTLLSLRVIAQAIDSESFRALGSIGPTLMLVRDRCG